MPSAFFKGSLIFIMVFTGALDTIDFKFQNSQYLYEGPTHKLFFHPYIQTLFMFFAEFISLPLFLLRKYHDPKLYEKREQEAQLQGKRLDMNRILLFIPAFFDFMTSTMQFVALNFISGSAYQLFRGGAIVTTYFFSVLFFKQKVKKPQVFGTIIAVLGMVAIGFANIIYAAPSSESNGMLQIVGYLLIFASLITNGFFFAFEQKLFETFHLQPMQVVGFEGLFGSLICIFILPILSSIPCSFGKEACVYSQSGKAYMEGWDSFTKGVHESSFLYNLIVFSIISVAIYNVAGVSITKHINALARAIAANTKTVLVWVFGIIVTVTLGKDYPNYQWESLNWIVILLQLFGFILLILGNLVYNQIIKMKLPKFLRRFRGEDHEKYEQEREQ